MTEQQALELINEIVQIKTILLATLLCLGIFALVRFITKKIKDN